jgi:hypothetical protein
MNPPAAQSVTPLGRFWTVDEVFLSGYSRSARRRCANLCLRSGKRTGFGRTRCLSFAEVSRCFSSVARAATNRNADAKAWRFSRWDRFDLTDKNGSESRYFEFVPARPVLPSCARHDP